MWQFYCRWGGWIGVHTLDVPPTGTVGDLKRLFLASIRLDPEKGPAFANGVFIAELRGVDDATPLSSTSLQGGGRVLTTFPMTDALRNAKPECC